MSYKKCTLFIILALAISAFAQDSDSWSDSRNRNTDWGSNYDTETNFTIIDEPQLAQFAYMVNSGKNFEGKTVTLERDLSNMGLHYWEPIGKSGSCFSGVFEGNNHTIIHVFVDKPSADTVGLFGCVSRPENSTAPISVKNITLSKSSINGHYDVGSIVGAIIAGENKNDFIFITDNHVADSVYVSGESYVGGLVGSILSTVHINGSASAANVSGENYVGGLVGIVKLGGYEVEYGEMYVTLFGSSIYYGNSISGTTYVGAIVGASVVGSPSLLNVFYPGVLNLDPVGHVGTETAAYSITKVNRVYSVTAEPSSLAHVEATLGQGTTYGNVTFYGNAVSVSGRLYYGAGMNVNLVYDATEMQDHAEFSTTYAGAGEATPTSLPINILDSRQDVVVTVTPLLSDWTGSGTEEDPYLIKFPFQLDSLAKRVNRGDSYEGKYFKLAADLDYSGVALENGNNYTPIASNTKNDDLRFKGHFDGDYHTISGIKISRESAYLGLFGVFEGTLKNLTIENSSIAALGSKGRIGALIGENYGTVENCHVKADVSVSSQSGDNVGGIIGMNYGSVNRSTSAATVSAGFSVGGVVGSNGNEVQGQARKGSVQNSLYYGTSLTISETFRGYVGAVIGNHCTDCTAKNNVYTTTVYNTSEHVLKGMGKNGSVTGKDTVTAALGHKVSSGTPNLSIFYGDSLAYDTNSTLAVYKNGSTNYKGLGFKGAVYVIGGLTYTLTLTVPTGYAVTNVTTSSGNISQSPSNLNVYSLSSVTDDAVISAAIEPDGLWDGEGTEGNPYQIATVTDMENLAVMVNVGHDFSGVYFAMMNDLDYENAPLDETRSNHTTIGYGEGSSIIAQFSGTFDGNNHIIKNLTINRAGTWYQGLFGAVGSSGVVKNLTLRNSSIYGGSRIGGIAAIVDGGTIENCHVDASVNIIAENAGNVYKVGGVVGDALFGTKIRNCHVGARVKSDAQSPSSSMINYVGGIVGSATKSIVEMCVYTGNTVEGRVGVGAISGKDWSGSVYDHNYYVENMEYYLDGDANPVRGVGETGPTDSRDRSGAERVFTLFDENATVLDDDATAIGYVEGITIYSNGMEVAGTRYYTGSTQLKYGAVNVSVDRSLATIDGAYVNDDEVEIGFDVAVDTVVFTRTFVSGAASTMMLPFSIAVENVEGAKFYGFSQMVKDENGKWTAGVSEVTGTLEANTPYLVKPTQTSLVFHGEVTLNTTGTKVSTVDAYPEWEFRGTYRHFVFGEEGIAGTAYGFVAKDTTLSGKHFDAGQFVKAGPRAYIPAMRAYLVYNESNGGAKSASGLGYGTESLPETIGVVLMDAQGNVTEKGTLNTVTGRIHMNRWFDVQGRVLKNKPTIKGRYLHNGRLEVVK